ncbi:hypothetical protein CK203_043536 [Vitis vinifera]|uniref:Uncharacterized protein n=1 Tax=Vitis vinifera TaxID=29760 RepID=A0A438HR84_VITVI|nr:hypothetical protein CK203_043536 [Vitis vinifera]
MEEPVLESPPYCTQNKHVEDREAHGFLTSLEKSLPNMDGSFETLTQVETFVAETEVYAVDSPKTGQPSSVCEPGPLEKTKGISNLSRINSRTERIEAWRIQWRMGTQAFPDRT